MKKLQIAGALLLSCAIMTAQATGNKQGPTQKNQKSWKKDQKSVIVTAKAVKKRGAALKNQKPWAEAVISATRITSEPTKKKGPKAKNSKPWE